VRAKLCGVEHRSPPIFGRATITLGIGPHSRILYAFYCDVNGLCALLLLLSNETSGQSNLRKRPLRRCTWTVHSYSPGGANAHPSNTCFLGPHPSPNPKGHHDRFSRFCTAHDRRSLYTLQWASPLPLKIAPSHGGSETQLIRGSLGPPESKSQTASRSV